MNEELRIIIKAVTDEAKKNLAGVKEELDGIQKEGNSVGDAMKAVAKGVGIAVGAFVALTAAMVTLTKRSMEFQKSYGQLTSSFQSSGSTVKQATQTYKDLFRFLGEADTATEAANLLVQLTNDEKELAEWTTILQGVYAKLPDSIPVESLAEAANETAKTGTVTGVLADALNWVGVSEDAMNAKLQTTNSLSEREAILRGTLNNLYGSAAILYERNNQALLAYNESQANLDIALANATRYVVPLMTQLNNLAALLLQVLKPAFETISAVVIVFTQWIIAAIQYIGSFFGLFSKDGAKATETVNKNLQQIQTNTAGLTSGVGNLGDSFNQAANAAKELKKQTMGFDELNVVSSQTSASTGGGYAGGGAGGGISGGGISTPSLEDLGIGELSTGFEDFQKKVEGVKEKLKAVWALIKTIGLTLGAIGLVSTFLGVAKAISLMMGDGYSFLGAIKALPEYGKAFVDGMYGDGVWDNIIGKMKSISGWVMIIAGAVLLVKGYSDAWINGLNWQNFAEILGGISLIVGGLLLAFGSFAAAIGLIVGGVVALTVGIKDLITNGYSMQAVIMVLVGAIGVAVGIMWAFNSALLANPITWVVVGIAALVAAFVILWNECEGFRNFWKALWEGIKTAFKATWDWLKTACSTMGTWFASAGQAIKNTWNAIPGFFSSIWTSIKNAFSAVKSWFSSIFTSGYNAVKSAFSAAGSFFSGIWSNIKSAFSAVKSWFSSTFSGAWSAVKSAFSSVSSFFTGIWDSIKKVFSNVGATIGNAITNTVKTAINGVLSTAIGIINGFISAINTAISVINLIPGVSITKLSKLDVPKMATGGIVTSATHAIIGEAGKEAVLPLENNTGWMDILADRIASRNNTPSRLVLMLDGKELGYATINSFNDIYKQTGNLPILIG